MLNIDHTIKRLINNNPMTSFIKALFLKWSLIIIIPAVSATYVILKNLHESGVLNKLETKLTDITNESQSIIQNCFPKITYNNQPLQAFMRCVENPPSLKKGDAGNIAGSALDSQSLIKNANQIFNDQARLQGVRESNTKPVNDASMNQAVKDPYDED